MRMSLRHSLSELLELIDQPNRAGCESLYQKNKELFDRARGSKTKHQAWEGGYLDHVIETCNIGLVLYDTLSALRPLPFTKSDVVLVMYLHDLEKPWKHVRQEDTWKDTAELGVKSHAKAFVLRKAREFGIILTPEQENALLYVEGENESYDPNKRVMNELGALCHSADILSARLWYNYPRQDDLSKA